MVEGQVLLGLGRVGEYAYAVAVQLLLSENPTFRPIQNILGPLYHVRQGL